MDWFRILAVRLLALFRKGRAEDEMAEEFQCHLAMGIEENLSRGISPEDARSAAMRSFGGMDQAKEACRDQRGFPFLEAAWWDLVFGIRLLRRSPGFTAVAVLTIALGIGANTGRANTFRSFTPGVSRTKGSLGGGQRSTYRKRANHGTVDFGKGR